MLYQRKRWKKERGQALAELAAGLIALCAVIIGVLAIALVGMEGIRNTIKTRQTADQYSMNRIKTGNPEHITSWVDPDQLLFTNDDYPRVNNFPDATEYTSEMISTDKTFRLDSLSTVKYIAHNIPNRYIESRLFLSAADLTVARKQNNDPLEKYYFFDAQRILKALGLPTFFTIKDEIAMPINPN